MGLLKDHVYRNLKDYGNSFIMPDDFNKLGIDSIVDDLKEHGFTCLIEKRECSNNYFGVSESLEQKKTRKYNKKQKDIIYVVTDLERM